MFLHTSFRLDNCIKDSVNRESSNRLIEQVSFSDIICLHYFWCDQKILVCKKMSNTICKEKHKSVEERDKKLYCQWCDEVFNSDKEWREAIEELKKKHIK